MEELSVSDNDIFRNQSAEAAEEKEEAVQEEAIFLSSLINSVMLLVVPFALIF